MSVRDRKPHSKKREKKKERSKDCAKLQNGTGIIIPNGLVIRPFRGGVAGAFQVIALCMRAPLFS